MRTSAGAANGIGQPLRRKEDFRLLTGRGRYGDDLALPRMVHAAFVRSPHAHARIRSMDKTAAPLMLSVASTISATESSRTDYSARTDSATSSFPLIGCKAGAVQAALGHPKFGSKFQSTLMRDDFFVRIKSSALVRAIVRSSQR
jgi:CO/xanthine dehydrogenase Mo-binding subunit